MQYGDGFKVTNFWKKIFLHEKVDKIRAIPVVDYITCTNSNAIPAAIRKFEKVGMLMAVKVLLGVGGFQKILRNLKSGSSKILCLLTRWVGGSKKGPKHAYVIYEWSLNHGFCYFYSFMK